MKIACSSTNFAHEIAAGTLTQLEWLDACANELEVDGIVFDLAQFPRTDSEYCAQLKKTASDLGLTVAGVADRTLFADDGASETRAFEIATALGAPIVVASAEAESDGAGAWGTFVAAASGRARAAKRANVTLAVRATRGTVCGTSADLKRLAKDVDSSWLRFALEPSALAETDATSLRPKAVVAWHDIANPATFATEQDDEAATVIARLARFRGFVVLAAEATPGDRSAYHGAIDRFTHLRARDLALRA